MGMRIWWKEHRLASPVGVRILEESVRGIRGGVNTEITTKFLFFVFLPQCLQYLAQGMVYYLYTE